MIIVIAWLLHCLLIAGVLTAGAFAWEAGARWSGGAARWGWLTALVGSVTLPWLLRLVPVAAVESIPVAMPVLTLDPVVLQAGAAQPGLSAGEAALLVWLACSTLVLLYVGVALLRLQRVRARWRETQLDGGRVLLTQGVGPAAVGVRDAQVVVPSWALQLDAELRSLLLKHEREHVRAGDPRLLLSGLLLLAAMPWNPLVWLQVLRLRNAIELDCDARVLSGGADPERYGSLLLEVGRRRSTNALVMATFSEPRVFLEERIRRIARWPLDRRPLRALAFTLAGLVLFATALSARDPLRAAPRVNAVAELLPELRLTVPSDTPPLPRFTPMTVRPELRDREAVMRLIAEAYPRELREAGIGGSAVLFFFINTKGEVEHVRLSRSSGYPVLDSAAMTVARRMQFSPAVHRGAEVDVWVEIPVVFNAGRGVQRIDSVKVEGQRRTTIEQLAVEERRQARLDEVGASVNTRPVPPPEVRAPVSPPDRTEQPIIEIPPPPPQQQRPIDVAPTFTPMTERPELANRAEVQRAIARAYPTALREAGIGGSPVLWLFIDENGKVQKTQLSKSSGQPELDTAALSIVSVMQFAPARNRDRIVPVWVEIPVVFTAR